MNPNPKRKSLNERIFKDDKIKKKSLSDSDESSDSKPSKKRTQSIFTKFLKKKEEDTDSFDFEELCKITEIQIEF